MTLKRLFIAVGTVVFLWLVVFGFVTTASVRAMFKSQQLLKQSVEQMSQADFAAAHDSLEQAHLFLFTSQNRLTWLNRLPPFFLMDETFQHFFRMMRSTDELIGTLDRLYAIGEEIVALGQQQESAVSFVEQDLSSKKTFKDFPAEIKRLILQRFQSSADELEYLITQIQLIREEYTAVHDALDRSLLPIRTVFDEVINPIHKKLAATEEDLKFLSFVARILPSFGALDQEQIHLLLFLNESELRPGGGFLGTYGVARVKDAEFVSVKVADVYALDEIAKEQIQTPAPLPMQEYNEATVWFFRDSNWSPDFATSSLESIRQFLFESSVVSMDASSIPTASRVDGVFGFTIAYASKLLEILGPLSVADETITSENIRDLLQYQTQFGYVEAGLPPTERKEMIAELVHRVVDSLMDLPVSEWASVLSVTREAFQSKQLFLYHSNQALENVITEIGWGGRILPKTVDIQLFVDANLASLKSDPAVDREISYEFFKNSNSQWIGRTRVGYEHRGVFDAFTTRYRTYARLYVPKGSRLIRVEGSLANDRVHNPEGLPGTVTVGEELDLTVFGTFTSVEPGDYQELIFEYFLSDAIVAAVEEGTYSLTIFKQLGARDYPLTLELNFDTPLLQARPAEVAEEFGDASYRLNTILDQDRNIIVQTVGK